MMAPATAVSSAASPTSPSTSLQIPATDMSSGSSRHQISNHSPSANASRPVSVAVHSQNPPPVSSSSRRQQRASHSVVPSSSHSQQPNSHTHANSNDDNPPYTDVFSHPAAVAYATAHPRRTIPKFGPYLLLQTLGEGEFGKVKLGLHSQYGEEVAVKLIRRGNVDTSIRMSKVEREIEVLRSLKHPNIVRLYDVIETDKYIGIILEYASGGELFDHILAHRYLRERDAAKLFSQLISGVWYIHQKKIVHRDLKLENLLLDRHRNVIITDFGFANRFEHRADDLMQTSCGSPCYAAPELVISEGLYVGSAVDIWSCGVILYAMLAGYLPFDDDPANPDGDNINLLYKYIVNTPLSFPEYISAEARDLLSMMLVPDPKRRASLESVMRHTWLGQYAGIPRDDGSPSAFGKTVEDLERAAMEQHHQKRLAYQRQLRAAVQSAQGQTSPSSRTQSHHALLGHSAAPTSAGRSRSTQPEVMYDSSIDHSLMSPAPAELATPTSGSRKPQGSPAALGLSEDDPFAPPGGTIPSTSVVVTTTTTTTTNRQRTSEEGARGALVPVDARAQTQTQSPKGHRASGSGSGSGGGGFRHTIQVEYDEPKSGRRSEEKRRDRSSSQGQQPQHQPQSNGGQQNGFGTPPPSSNRDRRTSQSPTIKPLPPSPQTAPRTPKNSSSPPKHQQADVNLAPVRLGDSTPVATPLVSISSPPDTPIAFAHENKETTDQGSVSSIKKGHKKGRSSLDKLGLGKIFSGGGNSPVSSGAGSDTAINSTSNGRVNPPSNSSSVILSPVVAEKEPKKEDGKKSRRNTLTVMVEPIKQTIRNRGKSSRNQTPSVGTPATGDAASVESGRSEKGKLQPRNAVLPPTETTFVNAGDGESTGPGIGMQASTSKARKVMQWFRTKSKQDSAGLMTDEEGRTEKDGAEYKKGFAASSGTLNQTPVTAVSRDTDLLSPSIASSTNAPRKSIITPSRTPSTATDSSVFNSGLVARFRNSVTVGGMGSSNHHHQNHHAGASGASSRHPYGQLRIHHGAVDQTTITTRAPPEVMKHVREVLEVMGVEIQLESEYKYRCIRAKRKKSTIVNGPVGAGNLAAVNIVGTAASNGVDKRGLPMPSPSAFASTGGMLRGLLMRRQSSQVSTGGGMGASQPSLAFDDETSVVVNEPTIQDAAYGDPSQDAGDEVRFSVELTRLDRLNDTYSLDIRRLKGNLRSYKFLYDTLRQRADLQR